MSLSFVSHVGDFFLDFLPWAFLSVVTAVKQRRACIAFGWVTIEDYDLVLLAFGPLGFFLNCLEKIEYYR